MNYFRCLRDEWEIFFDNDSDFILEPQGEFINDAVFIARHPLAFNIAIILAKIIGPICLIDCTLNLIINFMRGDTRKEDEYSIFLDMSSGIKYNGQIIIKKGF